MAGPTDAFARAAAGIRAKRVVDSLSSNLFCAQEPGLFTCILSSFLDAGDVHFHQAEFTA
jgi:hypothetical protein